MADLRVNDRQISTMGRIGYFLVNCQSAFQICIPTFLIIYSTNVLGIKIALVSLMIALVKVFDGITDVLAGMMIDATKTRWGKARPWLLFMCLPYGLCFALEFLVPPTWSMGAKTALLVVFYTLTVSVFGTVVGIATRAMLPRMSTNPREYSKVGAVCGAAGVTLCGFLMSFVFPLQAKLGFGGTFILFGTIVFILTLLGFLMCRELPDEVLSAAAKSNVVHFKDMIYNLAHNKYALLQFVTVTLAQIAGQFIMACGTYYAIYVLGSRHFYTQFMLCGAFGSLAGLFISPFLCSKIGNKMTYLVGCALAILGFGAIRITGDNPTVVIVAFFFILMGGQVFTNGQGTVFAAQCVEYGEWKNGIRSDGVISCTGNVGNKIGSALGSAVVGALLAAGGFVEGGVEQTAAAVNGIRMTYTVGCPIAYLVLLVFFALTWNIEKLIPQMTADLAERRKAKLGHE